MEPSLPIWPHPLRRRFWKAGTLIALFIGALLICDPFFSPPRKAVTRDMLGHDFLVFYAAGKLARTGQYHKLYDLGTIKSLEVAAGNSAGMSVGYGPWWNPPYAAWFFAPFTVMRFSTALIAWWLFGIAAVLVSAFLLARMLPGDWRNKGLVPLLVLISGPFWAVLTHAQNTYLTLLLLSITATLWRARRPWLAGMVAGLLLYKPQHAAVVAPVLILTLGWQAAGGLAMTSLGLIVTTMVTMPGALTDYLHKLPHTLTVMQVLSDYSWDRHVTLKAFWRMWLQGTNAGQMYWTTWGLWWMSELLAMRLLWKSVTAWRDDPANLDRLIAASVVATPLLVPFFFDYDTLILAVPAVLCAADALRNGLDRPLLRAWVFVFLLMYASNPIAHHTSFNPAAPALLGLLAVIGRRRQIAAAHAMRIEAEAELPRALAA
ncbi:MAG TPA: glycosyltransferase family 87 protein [Tepidisphaeraceae bacterium]|nr:glycosyltransferase family 87 protein [Tepidisphaeraceae bacterium]